MIAVVDYEPDDTQAVMDSLKRLGIECVTTRNEAVVCKADKIILPDAKNVLRILKNLQLYNLYNVLKMLKKPILAINNALIASCKDIDNNSNLGLGFLDCNAGTLRNLIRHWIGTENVECEFIRDSRLLKDFEGELKFSFACSYFISPGEYTRVSAKINTLEISAIVESGNFFGVQFNPERSGIAGDYIFRKFTEII